MAAKRKLFARVEALLLGLFDEADRVAPAVFDEDGVEVKAAVAGPSFGERLKLAEVAANFETRRGKAEEEEAPDEMAGIVEMFHGSRTAPRRGKARASETDGIANAGRTLPPFAGPHAGGGNA